MLLLTEFQFVYVGHAGPGFDWEIGALPPPPPHLLYELGGFGQGFRVQVGV
jgi:hypothetical protein